MTTTLYHYTCSHGRADLGDEGHLLPGASLTSAQLAMPWTASLVWLTDLPAPIRDALGLTSNFIRCDRTRYRYRVVDPTHTVRWVLVARNYPRAEIENAPGVLPMHWWVADRPVPVVYDPIGGAS